MPDQPTRAHRGRGSLTNPEGRFEVRRVEAFDDGWGTLEEEPGRPRTTVTPEATRSPFSRNDSPDVPFNVSINPYKGCEHGCIYCFARRTHSFLGLSPGMDFETKLFSKPDAPQRLREAFRKKSYQPELIALGANTDPYQPVERDLRITRALLEVFLEFRHPLGIVTKSQGILRDLDLLTELASMDLVHVMVSVTSLDPDLASRMEPRATAPRGRVETIRRLSEAGVPVGVLASPILPGLNDHELESILEACAGAGADSAGTILLRLPDEVEPLFVEWMEEHYPDRKDKVLGLLRECRGGEVYRARFGERMGGSGPVAALLRKRLEVARRKLGLEPRGRDLDFTRFRVPPRAGQNLDLFGA